MSSLPKTDREPSPSKGVVQFQEEDLFALSGGLARDPAYNDARLCLRRKLATLAKTFTASPREPKLPMDSRTSLHNPHTFNGNQVRRLWAYICRDKKEKARLKKVVGADLAKDLNAAFRNAYLCLAVEAEGLETSLRIHSDAWFDGQNLVRRVQKEGFAEFASLLNELDGYFLRLADWKGEWRCGDLDGTRLKEFFGYYKPGEHALVIEKRWPAPKSQPALRAALFGEDVADSLLAELERLLPVYRFTAWSEESDHLFG
jgi:hypothetical protein